MDAHTDVLSQFVASQVPAAFMATKIIDWIIANPRIMILTEDSSKRAKVLAGAIVAGAMSLGIGISWSYADNGSATLAFTGLTIGNVSGHLWQFATQWATQQFFHERAKL